MNAAEIATRLDAILVDVLMLEDPTVVVPEAQLVADLGAESINVAEIAVAIENEFGIAVPDALMAGVPTVAALRAAVEAALAKAGS